MALFYSHAVLMTISFLLMSGGVTAARFFRRKRWWLKYHRHAGVTGSVVLFFGIIMAFLMVAEAGVGHLKLPHAWLGAVAFLLAIAAPVLGQMQFHWKAKAQKIRGLHRWSGRLTLSAVLLNMPYGLWLAGII